MAHSARQPAHTVNCIGWLPSGTDDGEKEGDEDAMILILRPG